MSIKLVMPSNYLIHCRPLLLLPSIFSSMKVFSNESALCIRCPNDWSLSFSNGLSNEYSGLISFWPGVGSSSSVISFHTARGVLTASILEWFAILSPQKIVVLLPAKSLQLCLTLWYYGLQPIRLLFQARILECFAIFFSRGSSRSRDRTQVSCIAGRFLTVWATREALSIYYFFKVFTSIKKSF